MADFGFNFRATSGFVTDGTGECPVLAELYPHTYTLAGGGTVTAGWVTNAPDTVRDRDAALDRRLAGMNARNGSGAGVTMQFQVDLPASGSYIVAVAYGDGNSGATPDAPNIAVKDNTTSLFTVTAAPGTGHMTDAANNTWTYAAWPGSEVTSTQTFASTTFLLVLGDTATHFSPLAHLRITSAAAGYVPYDVPHGPQHQAVLAM